MQWVELLVISLWSIEPLCDGPIYLFFLLLHLQLVLPFVAITNHKLFGKPLDIEANQEVHNLELVFQTALHFNMPSRTLHVHRRGFVHQCKAPMVPCSHHYQRLLFIQLQQMLGQLAEVLVLDEVEDHVYFLLQGLSS